MLKILLIAAAVTWKTPSEFRPNVDPVVTHVDLSGLVTEETDPTVPDWAKQQTPPTSAGGTARPLPKYLYALDFADSYPDDAAWYYEQQQQNLGGCSSVRDGNTYSRNYDWMFDDAATFVIRCVATAPSPSCPSGRFESIGVANVGTNLTEQFVSSGKFSRYYKCLPGHTVDGINSEGVVCNINVVTTNGAPWEMKGERDINALGAVRWVLDTASSAEYAASNLAFRVFIPESLKRQGFSAHFMIADKDSTYIVENGVYSNVTGRAVMTNFPLLPTRGAGEGQERYDALMGGANITSQWWTLTYTPSGYRASDLPGITGDALAQLFEYWGGHSRESHRGESFGGVSWWQTVHTSVYNIQNRTLRIAVQEIDDWYTFSLGADATLGSVVKVANIDSPDGTFQDRRVQIGENAQAIGVTDGGRNQSIAIGFNAEASGMTSIAIGSGGSNADGTANAPKARGGNSVAIGYDAEAETQSVSVGQSSKTKRGASVAIGLRATAYGQHDVAIGTDAVVTNWFSTKVIVVTNGTEIVTNTVVTTNTYNYSVAIGKGAVVKANNSVQIGAGMNTKGNTIKFQDEYLATENYVSDNYQPKGNYLSKDSSKDTEEVYSRVSFNKTVNTYGDVAFNSSSGTRDVDFYGVNVYGTSPKVHESLYSKLYWHPGLMFTDAFGTETFAEYMTNISEHASANVSTNINFIVSEDGDTRITGSGLKEERINGIEIATNSTWVLTGARRVYIPLSSTEWMDPNENERRIRYGNLPGIEGAKYYIYDTELEIPLEVDTDSLRDADTIFNGLFHRGEYLITNSSGWRAIGTLATKEEIVETDPTVPAWSKAPRPPDETDPTVPAWAKETNPPVTEESDPIFSEFASNTYVSVGGGSKANHVDSIAIGHNAEVSGVLGTNGQYTLSSPYGIAIGSGSTTIGTNSISLGNNASASESFGIAIGHGSKATKRYSIAIGEAAKSDIVLKGIAIGATSKTESQEAIAIGPGATVNKISTKSIAIGSGAIVNVNKSGATAAVQIGPGTNKDQGTIQFLDKKLATENYVDEYKEVANNALAYANAIYDYMSGNTNAWFSGTNYVTNADAASRTIFAWEDGMDPATVPCSMALWENRDGRRQCVWDQRDWTVWYWNFKAAQMKADAAATNATIYAAIGEKADRAWSKYTAAEGLENPDPNTTWINTKNIQLAAGYAWQSLAEVNGCGYWTIVGDGAVIGGSDTNATLVIKDFEGNQVLRITKGSNRLVYLDKNDYVSQGRDAQGRITFVVNSPVQPTGSFSTALDLDAFVDEDDVDCPADVEWESLGGGQWRVHFLLKNGILADQCFARFRVFSSGQTTVEYDAAQKISGGLIYNGVKIAPEITGNPSVGTVIQWKVVP